MPRPSLTCQICCHHVGRDSIAFAIACVPIAKETSLSSPFLKSTNTILAATARPDIYLFFIFLRKWLELTFRTGVICNANLVLLTDSSLFLSKAVKRPITVN